MSGAGVRQCGFATRPERLRRGVEACDEGESVLWRSFRTRALLLFRLGDYDKSIADYDAALKINPKYAFALYGRGIDELRKQKTQEGQADVAQAMALSPKIADGFDRYGIDP